MKAGIHPEVKLIKVVCSGCNTEFETLSTEDEIRVEICADCHPFFTGEQRFVDTEGRVETFERRYGKVKAQETKAEEAPAAEAKPAAEAEAEAPSEEAAE